MELQGQINEIIYQNEVNGYTIAEFIYGKEATTIVGYLPFINNGDSLKVFGTFVIHQEYGRQFKIETFEKIMPESLEALEKYLSGGIIKGVGPATAKRIVDTFGEETISVFKFEPEKLSKVKGINEEKALKIAEEFNEKWELWQIVGFLEKFGIGASNSKSVYKQLGVNAIKQIEENPYILLDITYGVDFKKIDKMAMDLGLDNNNEKRICSAIKYGLILASYNGHTCVILENLIEFIKNLINVSTEDIEENIINLNSKQEIKIDEFEENKWVFLKPFYICEKNISEKLLALDKANNIKSIKKFNNELEKIEKNSEIDLSDKQKEAIKAVNDNNVCVITGGPGTGKTTIIKSIIKLYEKEKRKIVLCAPTRKSCKKNVRSYWKRSNYNT